MILESGNMWDTFGDGGLFLFTSNRIVNSRGLAVMGRGIARQMADNYPEVQEWFGATLKSGRDRRNVSMLGKVEREDPYIRQTVGYFMVKDHFAEAAKLPIIRKSVEELAGTIERFKIERVNLNFPGIGNGKLAREEVLPIIEQLPDNVHVWEYTHETS